MKHRVIFRAVLMFTWFFTSVSVAQDGAVMLSRPKTDIAPSNFSIAAAQEEFVMRPSVLTSSLSPYGTGPQRYDTFASCALGPSGPVVPNCNITIRWNARANSGGHMHNTNRPPGIFLTQYGVSDGSTSPGPPGSVTDSSQASGVLGLTYTAPEASGVIDLTLTGVATVGGQTLTFGPSSFAFGVRFEGLQFAIVPGLQVHTVSDMHGNNNGYATPDTILSLGVMTQGFARFLSLKNLPVPILEIPAISLPEGGLFDDSVEWTPPHVSHRFGNDVDILTPPLTNQQRRALEIARRAAGFTTPVRAESSANPGASHWHLRL